MHVHLFGVISLTIGALLAALLLFRRRAPRSATVADRSIPGPTPGWLHQWRELRNEQRTAESDMRMNIAFYAAPAGTLPDRRHRIRSFLGRARIAAVTHDDGALYVIPSHGQITDAGGYPLQHVPAAGRLPMHLRHIAQDLINHPTDLLLAWTASPDNHAEAKIVILMSDGRRVPLLQWIASLQPAKDRHAPTARPSIAHWRQERFGANN